MENHPLREDYPWEAFWADCLAYGLMIQPPQSGGASYRLLRAGFPMADEPRFILRHEVAAYHFRNLGGLEEHGLVDSTNALHECIIRAIHQAFMECPPGQEPAFSRVVELCWLYKNTEPPLSNL